MQLNDAKEWIRTYATANRGKIPERAFRKQLNWQIVKLSHEVFRGHGLRGHLIRRKIRRELRKTADIELRNWPTGRFPQPRIPGYPPSGGRAPFLWRLRKRFRVRWSYLFLGMWAIAFGLGLYLIPTTSPFYLVPLSFANALLVYMLVWGIAGITRRGIGRKAFGVLLILVLVGLAYQNYSTLQNLSFQSIGTAYQQEPSYVANLSSSFSDLVKNVGSGLNSIVAGYPAFEPANPSFVNGRANVTLPQNYTVFANYALSLVNKDRTTFGDPPLSLSAVASGQQHADSMDYFGYFEHVDNQGYSPEQRFDMLGGGYGLVGENQGFDYCNNSPVNATQLSPVPCNVQTIENGITNSEWGMMYNDAICCNNGHRMNILSTSYTQVAIGIAYNSSTNAVYFVEDFYGPCPAGYICP